MAIILIETAASATANTYCSLAEAETYMESKFHKTAWTAATDSQKDIVLAEATRLLDQHYSFVGFKYTELQALRWPRTEVLTPDGYDVAWTTIPQFLKDATAELALYILSSDVTAESDTKGIKEMKAGSLELVLDKNDRGVVIPDPVDEMLKFYGQRLETLASADILRV